jgi:hypothetical protein
LLDECQISFLPSFLPLLLLLLVFFWVFLINLQGSRLGRLILNGELVCDICYKY